MSMEPIYEVVWPLARRAGLAVRAPNSIADLSGKTVCELWDYQFRGDALFAILREELLRRFPDIKFVKYPTFGNTHGPNERAVVASLPGLLKEKGCGAVISAIGA